MPKIAVKRAAFHDEKRLKLVLDDGYGLSAHMGIEIDAVSSFGVNTHQSPTWVMTVTRLRT